MTPVAVSGLSGVVAISAASASTCAKLSNGTVQCWGDNTYGELGDATSTGPQTCLSGTSACSSTPVAVAGLNGVTAIATNEIHTCARMSGGTVECWGDNEVGELGDATNTGPQKCSGSACSTNAVAVSNLTGATAVSASFFGSCALLMNGSVECWGDNGYRGSWHRHEHRTANLHQQRRRAVLHDTCCGVRSLKGSSMRLFLCVLVVTLVGCGAAFSDAADGGDSGSADGAVDGSSGSSSGSSSGGSGSSSGSVDAAGDSPAQDPILADRAVMAADPAATAAIRERRRYDRGRLLGGWLPCNGQQPTTCTGAGNWQPIGNPCSGPRPRV